MEDEIRNLRKDLAKFTDWAKQSHELNQRNLSMMNDNFHLLLKLFLSQNGEVTLENLHCTSMTSKDGIDVERENSERDSSSFSYEAVNDFSDDEDVEESLRINPISLEKLSLNNSKKLADANSTTCSETSINSKSDLPGESGRKGRRSKITLTGKKFEQFLNDLKRKRENSCKRRPNALKLPDSYLEYGAARGWGMQQIRLKFYKDRYKAGHTRKVHVAKTTGLKNQIVDKRDIESPQPTPTSKQYEEHLRDLKLKREESCKKYPYVLKMPDSYLEYGAARGWDIKRVKNKFYIDRMNASRMRKVKVAKRTCFKNGIVDKRHIGGGPKPTRTLNLTPEQLQANLKALREEHAKSNICPIPDSYFQFGASRGWNLRQVSIKYYCRHKSKCDKYMGN